MPLSTSMVNVFVICLNALDLSGVKVSETVKLVPAASVVSWLVCELVGTVYVPVTSSPLYSAG